MRITSVEVANFRILERADIALDAKTTMVVGRNNSGKTSLTELFYKFLGPEKNAFSLDDFSVRCLGQFRDAYAKYLESVAQTTAGDAHAAREQMDQAVALVPEISLTMLIAYEVADDLAPIAVAIMDLDPTRKDAGIRCRLASLRVERLFKEFASVSEKYENDIALFLRKKLYSHFEVVFEAVDAQDTSVTKKIERSDVTNALSTRFIYAQNKLDDLSSDRSRGLSRGFEAYYKAISSQDGVIETLEGILATLAGSLDAEYVDLFESVFSDLKQFGVGTIESLQEIKIVSKFDAESVLTGSTQLVYAHGSTGDQLPESHNGLGYTKLIFTILQFIAFFEEFQKRVPQPGMQLVFVEEPEAHLHPQMQSVFINNIQSFLAKKDGWNVQIVVTTHSSHIVAESGFSCIRYFDNSVQPLEVKDLSQFEESLATSEPDALKFLKQYMVLHRCDMFFADKVILIEGTVERLVLPAMIREVADTLLHQYVSVVEVGGAYALKFKALLKFLNVQTLVITDLDSVEAAGRHPKCKAETADAITSNQTLKNWMPAKTTVTEILASPDSEKQEGRIKVAFQVPQTEGARCGRSFEEAFIIANADVLHSTSVELVHIGIFETPATASAAATRLTAAEIVNQAFELADAIDSKTDFAFDILQLEQWTTPRYINEGLTWLQLTPQS